MLKNVPEEHAFYVNDGRRVKNLYELAEALNNMKENTFKFHVNKKKNDFSEWIKHVIGEEKLANEVARLVMKDKIQIVIQRHVIRKMREDGSIIQ
jgi:hypothetical protein